MGVLVINIKPKKTWFLYNNHNINITPGFYNHIRQLNKKNQGLKFAEYKHIKTRGRPSKCNDENIRMHVYEQVKCHSEFQHQIILKRLSQKKVSIWNRCTKHTVFM